MRRVCFLTLSGLCFEVITVTSLLMRLTIISIIPTFIHWLLDPSARLSTTLLLTMLHHSPRKAELRSGGPPARLRVERRFCRPEVPDLLDSVSLHHRELKDLFAPLYSWHCALRLHRYLCRASLLHIDPYQQSEPCPPHHRPRSRIPPPHHHPQPQRLPPRASSRHRHLLVSSSPTAPALHLHLTMRRCFVA